MSGIRRYRPRRCGRLLPLAAVTLVGLGVAGAATPAMAAPVGAIRAENAPGAIRDGYLVVFKASASQGGRVASAATALGRRYGGAVLFTYTAALHGFAIHTSPAAAKRLAADPAVAYVEQDRTVSLSGMQANPPSWGLDRVDQHTLPLSRSYTAGPSAGVTAYVLDTGIRIDHTDFGGRARYGWDFIDGDAVADDCKGHGTHIAGTIGGAQYGVAKQVKLVAMRVLDCTGIGPYSKIIAGVDWVTKNAVKPAVANMSLLGPASDALDGAIQDSIASGVTYAVAAGNTNTDACHQSPARTAEAITVGATDSTDARATFSNVGACLDLFAPGVQILSDSSKGTTATAWMSGTSMAAPHVTGAAALVLGTNPRATPAQVRDALVNGATASRVKNPGPASPNRLLYTAVAVPA
jgi:subtilisin family serine protease